MDPRVTVSLGMTVNLGDFNSLRADVSFSRDLREGEDPQDAYNKLRRLVESELDKTIKSARGK